MRLKKICEKIKEYWISLLLILVALILAIIEAIDIWDIPTWTIVFFLFMYAILSFLDKRGGIKDFKHISNKLRSIEELNKKVDKRTTYFERHNKKRESEINLVNELLNNGLIEEEEVYNNIESKELYGVYCFANPLPIVKSRLKKYEPGKRYYPKFFEDKLNFVRMGKRSSFFVITSNRLPKELRDTLVLKKYILTEVDKLLKKEWRDFLDGLKSSKSFKSKYHIYKKQRYKDILKFTVTIIRGKINENNLGYLYDKILPKAFYNLINQEVDLNKIDIPQEKKVAVKKFVLNSSFELFFYGIKDSDLTLLKALEQELKQKLSISSFIDYTKKSEEDIAKIFQNKFSKSTSLKYAKLLKKRSNEYKSALKALGITF